jgi:tRNA dimethylallyltransferase
LVLAGPTAVGKTALAVALARRLGGEIIGADSRQIYRGMDIGTAKPTPEERAAARHHLIDIVDPDQTFSAAEYARAARGCIAEITARGALPILVGGTGLYLRAALRGLFEGPPADPELRERLRELERTRGPGALHERLAEVDPETARHLSPRDIVRIERALEVYELTGRPLSVWHREHAFAERPFRTLYLGLTRERAELYRRIEARVVRMFQRGFVAEVEGLLAAGYGPELPAMSGLGYRTVVRLLRGDLTPAQAVIEVATQTRRYAKRQLTWFRKEPIDTWIRLDETSALPDLVERITEACHRLLPAGEESHGA